MKKHFQPLRLLAETLLIITVAELAVMAVLPQLGLGLSPLAEGLLDVGMLAALSGPAIFWRFNAALSRPAAALGAGTPGGKATTTTALQFAALAQIAGLLITGGFVAWQAGNLAALDQDEFARETERIRAEVLRRFNQPLYGLKAARGAMAAQPQFGAQEFRAYVESSQLLAELPGIRGFGFIERVERKDLARFTAAQQDQQASGFEVKTQGTADDLYIIKHIEPLANNRAAHGFDVGQEAVRRQALELAISSGKPTLTGRIELVQDAQRSPGFLYLLPVFQPGSDTASPEARRTNLLGFVYFPLVAQELFRGIEAVANHRLQIGLYDDNTAQPQALVYASPTAGQTPGGLQKNQTLAVGDRVLTLSTQASSQFMAMRDRSSLTFIGAGGVLLSALLAVAVWLLAAGRERAHNMAQGITAELTRMAQVVEHTDNAVTIMDPELRIVWVNAGFEHITGYTQQEALGKRPGELLAAQGCDPEAIATLMDSAKRRVACRVELLNRAKDGRHYWADTEVQPTFGANGTLIGFMEIGRDITAQKEMHQRLEASMREASAWLKTLEVHAIVSETDHLGTITSVNDAFCRVSGYSREELIGQNHRIVNSRSHSLEFWQSFWDTISSGKPWRGDICNQAKDGSLYWVDSMIAPFAGDDGQIEKYVSIRTDITAKVQASEQLRQSEQTFTSIFDNAASGMATLAPNGQWLKVNQALCDFLGYSAEELHAFTFEDITHPDEIEADREQMQSLLAGDITVYQRAKRYLHREGHVIWGWLSVSVVRDSAGKPLFHIAQIMDITARKNAEESLTRINALMEESQRVARVGGWEFDLRTQEVFWTLETYRIHDTTPEDFVPSLDTAMGFYTEDSLARLGPAVDAAIAHGQGYDLELQIRVGNGRLVDVRATGSANRENGQTISLSGIFQDITERKRYERSLQEARDAAEQATQSKGQFLATMSHEIRTPMNAILGMLKLMGNTPLNPNQFDYLSKTEGAARSLLGLLNDILDFSKIDAGKMELDLRPISLDRLLRDLAVVLSANIGSKPIEVLYDLDPRVPDHLLADSMRLGQVLINLAGNAVKFTATGQVRIAITQEASEAPTAVRLHFAVQDSGIGIAPENQAKIFSGFSQAESSTSRRFGGTGLGLAISQRLVELMGGQIALDSTPGVGSTFHFTLTMQTAAPDGQEAGAANAPAAPPALQVLLVDDNPVARDSMARMMQALGWQVQLAESGAQALAQALTQVQAAPGNPPQPFDCLFIDWQMPDMDGWETLRRLRALYPPAATPPVVMLSANGRDHLAQRTGQEQGWLQAFMVKPVTATMLRESASPSAGGAKTLQSTQRSSQRQLAGMRVLVVDDNAINQQVAEELLSFEGALVSICGDGRQAVNAVASAKKQFDAVLMDVQMPVMDGYAATQTIREQLGLRALPIIGLTANAMASDREACLAAGMDEHVGKPFDVAQLVQMLLRLTGYMPPDSPPGNPTGAAAHTLQGGGLSDVTAAPLPQTEASDFAAALQRMAGNRKLFLRTVLEMDAVLAQWDAQWQVQLAGGERRQIESWLHACKGNAGTVGLVRLADKLAALEKSCREGLDLAALQQQSAPLPVVVEEARSALALLIASLQSQVAAQPHSPDRGPEGNPGSGTDAAQGAQADGQAEARQLLREQLVPLLEAQDLSALEVFAELREALQALPADALQPLEEALQDLDLDAALAVCQRMDTVTPA